mmetsp:Transcript_27331/g.37714  ORF Transcript_27331/g.37714 Transcript_27331/m.37714 type:complete len:96 (-) Transcript_27331:433-720(-)|eukprot:CAMPEP_0196598660 /NCGR_PEP_ID=MMETSP1081-20130531/94440_1 /TAXON_ID=36882 /ORGANISM="Pyramimonas amylifera, Strain CCMP720" /LENGTH=95 /DNA_ID=CAMNT_0041924377 /DNA_START=108 /DNA_END=395 /DNA_ORIENTATION=-
MSFVTPTEQLQAFGDSLSEVTKEIKHLKADLEGINSQRLSLNQNCAGVKTKALAKLKELDEIKGSARVAAQKEEQVAAVQALVDQIDNIIQQTTL